MSNKVLVADDDGNLRETLAEVLRSSGFEPILVPSGDQALARYDEAVAAGDPPAAFVVDLLLPKVAGFDVLKQLTARGNTAPVILMSGVFKGAGHQEEGQKLGAAAFLVKPFDNDALLGRLEKLLGPAGGATAGPPPGVEQRPMPAEGTLLENPVLHLLWRAEREVHSGVLEVFTPKGRARVFVFRGQCTLAQHWSKTLNLGFHLVKAGHLTPEMFQEATDEACSRGVGIHEVVKSRAWVRDAEIKEAYRAIVPRIVRKLVAAQGNFRWVPTEEFAKLIPAATTKLHDMLLAGVRESGAAELSYHVDPRGPLRIAPGENWDQTVRHLERACGSSSLERAINGRATITQLLDAARNDEERVARMRQIYLLMSTQSVQASLDVIKMANPPPDPEPEPVVEPAPAPASHGAVVSQAATFDASPGTGGDDAALDAGIDFNLEEEDARERIRMKWSMVRGKDHWAVLGVERGADQGEIKKAYFALAREYHADAFSGMRLGSMQPVLDKLFALISEAYNTLSNPAKRAEYEASINMREAGVSTDLGALFAAERDFDKGRLLLERGELTSAARFFEKALQANPSNTQWEAHTVYAQWWLTRDPSRASAAVARLEAIWKDNQQFLDALYFAGRLCIESGSEDRGRKMLKKVLAEDPQHAMAQRDLRHLVKKAEDAAKEKAAAGGLMGRFLKR